MSYHLIFDEGFMGIRAVVLYGEGLDEVDEKQLAKDLNQRMPAGMTIPTGGLRRTLLSNVEAGSMRTVRGGPSTTAGEHLNSERIDKQWSRVKPALWGDGKHSGERKMLVNLIEEGEDIECLIGGHFGPDLGHASWKDRTHCTEGSAWRRTSVCFSSIRASWHKRSRS